MFTKGYKNGLYPAMWSPFGFPIGGFLTGKKKTATRVAAK